VIRQYQAFGSRRLVTIARVFEAAPGHRVETSRSAERLSESRSGILPSQSERFCTARLKKMSDSGLSREQGIAHFPGFNPDPNKGRI
jgi:hypothetical protein